jgi:hypothetical protein
MLMWMRVRCVTAAEVEQERALLGVGGFPEAELLRRRLRETQDWRSAADKVGVRVAPSHAGYTMCACYSKWPSYEHGPIVSSRVSIMRNSRWKRIENTPRASIDCCIYSV